MTRNVHNVCTQTFSSSQCNDKFDEKNTIVVLEIKSGRLNKHRRYKIVFTKIDKNYLIEQ